MRSVSSLGAESAIDAASAHAAIAWKRADRRQIVSLKQEVGCHSGFPAGFRLAFSLSTLALSAWNGAHGQDLKSFEQRITVKVLPNGLTLIICERPEAPVFSYTTFIDAGDVNDPSGESGLAHMFEHLAFKGTSQIGTTDYADEKVALAKVEAANDAYEAEYLKPVGARPAETR